jgi:ABC-type lipoprotein export system ATPase subunit
VITLIKRTAPLIDNSNWIFKVDNLKKTFLSTRRSDTTYLRFKNIRIERGALTLITGETGIGKTSLLNLLGLMDEMVLYHGDDIIFKPLDKPPISYRYMMQEAPERIEQVRYAYFGFMFQQDHLIDAMTGWENVILSYLLRYPDASKAEAIEKAKTIIKACRFDDMLHGLMDRSPATYSGGQRQRTALVRAIIHDPMVIFADEPLASVDQETAKDIINILAQQKEKGISVIMVVHDTHEYLFDSVTVNKIRLRKQK